MACADYRTIAAFAEDQFVEKRSRFIGAIAPVSTEEEALAFLEARRELHREATHKVYVYTLREGGLTRFSDDGEPSGTAGKPALDVLRGSGLVDVAIVVTRYFGGTLLGTGGLTRAYAQGARIAIQAAQVVEMTFCTRLRLVFPYGLYGKVSYMLPRYQVQTVDAQFADLVTMELLVKADQVEPLGRELEELSSGTVIPDRLETLYAPFPQ